MIKIGSHNVGRIAERIVANELEARGFRVSDLNKEGTAANADLLAVSPRKSLQIQVKGSTNGPKERLWVGYGHLTKEILARSQKVFNRKHSFYKADLVVLVAVRSPTEYSCFVLPIRVAERAAQFHVAAWLDRGWKPGRTHLTLEPSPRAKKIDPRLARERKLLALYRGEKGWKRLIQSN
ncbi:MAG: hypothetical protein WCD49_17870 [Candidatus Acidiferrales bacterium]